MVLFKNVNCMLLSFVLILHLVKCTEFVPVFMWSTNKAIDDGPAFHKINQEYLEKYVVQQTKAKPFLVLAFLEESLSPEDFIRRDDDDNLLFENLSNLRNSAKVIYTPHIQNPLYALKHIEEVVEVSAKTFVENLAFPDNNVLIIDLNDAQENEPRVDMLKRHDGIIKTIFDKALKKYDNVLALYTARHNSWVASEDTESRQTRSLLQADVPASQHFDNDLFFYSSSALYDGTVEPTLTVNIVNGSELTSTAKFVTDHTSLVLVFQKARGYWSVIEATLNEKPAAISDAYAPLAFSYHCGSQLFSNGEHTLELKDFQVQPQFKINANTTKFGDAYDCVGFTSVPIWSGLFVTFILLLILTLGITMMMDIKTMDRFDDPKGKTITINVSE